VRVRRELERTQWSPPERLRQLQLGRLRDLLLHAEARVPYYRELFARMKFDPCGIDSLADLSRLPFLTKDVVRANLSTLQANGAKDLKPFSTTGSAGDPLQFYIGKTRVSHDVAAKWRAIRWWGVDIGDPEIVAWSSRIELTAQDLIRQARDLLLRSRLLSTEALSPKKMDQILADIRAFRPRMLFGYPSSIAMIAERAQERGLCMNDLGIKVAFVTAERVYPHQRDAIRRVFNCAVADGYGGRDSGFIAHECTAGGLHITAEDLVVEIVDSNGRPLPAGELGEVVITHFFTHDFPFIRYKAGDVAALDDRPCPCGRSLPLIKEVRGRTNDFLVSSNGERIHDVAFASVLREIPGIRQFKIIQESLDHVRLQLVVGIDFDEGEQEAKIRDTFRRQLGSDLKLDIEYVLQIDPELSGKHRYVVNRIIRGSSAFGVSLMLNLVN
jgi:phenylacetate-CoA ligase